MALLSGITNFLDKYLLGYALGTAAGPSLEPFVQDLANEAWTLNQVLPLDAEVAAAIVAEDVAQQPWGEGEASLTGVGKDRFDKLLGEALNAPGLGPLFELWRRGLIGDAGFTHGLRKAKLEGRWDGPLEGLKETLLSSEELAMMQQQGFIPASRADSEGSLQGVTSERQQLRFEASGLPPGIDTALQMLRRGIIGDAEFAQIVREGHTKTKYTDELLALRQPILSATEYATLHLKGHVTAAEMNAGGALSGYTPAQMNLLYLGMGRPAAPGQLWTAATRGIDGPTGQPMNFAQFETAIKQSDIRPEYAPMLWDIRYTYPPLFQINRLVQGGAIDTATAVEWARKDRLAPEVVTALEAYWSGGTATTADPHISKAQTQLWGTLHRSYIAGESTKTAARPVLSSLGVTGTSQTAVLDLWDAERALVRKQLTPAQIKKAYVKGIKNQATGATWTRDDALAALLERGYSPADANEFLDL